MPHELRALLEIFDHAVANDPSGALFHFFELFPNPAWIKQVCADGALRMAFVNRAYTDEVGVSSSDYVGRRDREVFGSEALDLEINDRRVIATGRPLEIREPIAGVLWVGCKFPLFSADGRVGWVAGWARAEPLEISHGH